MTEIPAGFALASALAAVRRMKDGSLILPANLVLGAEADDRIGPQAELARMGADCHRLPIEQTVDPGILGDGRRH